MKIKNILLEWLKKIKECDYPFRYVFPAQEVYGMYYEKGKVRGLNNPAIPIEQCTSNGTFNIIGCLIRKNLRDANEQCYVTERGGKYEKGQTSWLIFTLEDDTAQMTCKISKKDYLQLGKPIAETGQENKDWYLAHGQKINGWNIFFVKNIQKITL